MASAFQESVPSVCVSLSSKDLEPEERRTDTVANFVVSHFSPRRLLASSPFPLSLPSSAPARLLTPRAFFAPRDKSGKNDEKRGRREKGEGGRSSTKDRACFEGRIALENPTDADGPRTYPLLPTFSSLLPVTDCVTIPALFPHKNALPPSYAASTDATAAK